MNATVVLHTVFGFILGSIPFAFLVGRWRLKVDIRTYGPDRNPGGINAWRAGGWRIGVGGGLLDLLKGLVPVLVAQHGSGIEGWGLVPIAIAPILGHAFSPWLRFRGGKALGASFGVWGGLTWGLGFLAFGLTLGLSRALLDDEGWPVIMGALGLLVLLVLMFPQPYLLALWAMNTAVLTWKHRHEFRGVPRLRFARSS